MSASSKKKLRREQEAAKMTEKQLTAKKEAKKVNLYTAAFVTVMVVLLLVAIVVGVNQTISSSGVREKKTVALTVGDHELSNAEMNYFFMDAVTNFYNSYGSYAAMFGLDVSLPLNEQVVNEETGATWADDFMTSAVESAKSVYALADAAQAAGHSLTEAEQTSLDTNMQNLGAYAAMYGYADTDAYLKAMYGNGASLESFKAYNEKLALASSYRSSYTSAITYTDADIQAADDKDPQLYSAYSYNTYYLSASRFLEGGTTAEDGTTTYTDEEKAASVTAAEAAAKALAAEEIASAADFDTAIAAMEINKDAAASSTVYEDTLSGAVISTYADWVTDSARKAGDITVVPSTSTSTAEDGTETTTTNGYYVIYFVGTNDNAFALKNVRHILVSYEGGTADETTGTITYSDEEKAAAMTAAKDILAQWESGDKTEDSFAALATEKSTDTGSTANGGLYENIYPGQPGQMVTEFEDWCYGEGRKAGDTGIVETTYGCHVMYFSGDSDVTYRNFLIEDDLRATDAQAWYDGLLSAVTTTEGDTKYISTDLVIAAG